MIRRVAGTLFACALFSSAFSTAAAADDCKLAQIASFDFAVRGDGTIVVPVSIEGTTVPVEVDTGSPVSVVDPKLAATLHLLTEDIVSDFMFDRAGEPYKKVATIHQLAIGTMHGSTMNMLVAPEPLSTDGGIQGVIGTDLLRQFDVDIDFGARKLNLFSSNHCEGKVVYWQADAVTVVPAHVVHTGQIKVPVTLDGHPFDAMLDTGTQNTHLTQEAAHDLFGLAPDSAGMTKIGTTGPGGNTPVYQHVFGSLGLQGIAFGHPTVHITEDLTRASIAQSSHLGSRLSHADEADNIVDLRLGTNELRHLHVYIATKEQNLYVSAASAPAVAATPAAVPATR